MSLTWRQISIFLDFSDVEEGVQLVHNSIAAQGDGEVIKQKLEDLNGRAIQRLGERRRMATNDPGKTEAGD